MGGLLSRERVLEESFCFEFGGTQLFEGRGGRYGTHKLQTTCSRVLRGRQRVARECKLRVWLDEAMRILREWLVILQKLLGVRGCDKRCRVD